MTPPARPTRRRPTKNGSAQTSVAHDWQALALRSAQWRHTCRLDDLLYYAATLEAVPGLEGSIASVDVARIRDECSNRLRLDPTRPSTLHSEMRATLAKVSESVTVDPSQAGTIVAKYVERLDGSPWHAWLRPDRIVLNPPDTSRPLRVAILGVFSAGKSSLINALLGVTFLDVGIAPMTARLTVIRHGPRERALIVAHDGSESQIAIDDLAGAGSERGQSRFESVARIIIEHPSEILKEITLYDTPGFNSGHERHEDVANQAIQECDAVIWLFKATKSGSEGERNIASFVERSVGKSIGVITAIDDIRPRRTRDPAGWMSEVDQVERGLRHGFPEIGRWARVSARWITEGVPEGGRETLIKVLDSLRADRDRLICGAHHRKLLALSREGVAYGALVEGARTDVRRGRRDAHARTLEALRSSQIDLAEEMELAHRIAPNRPAGCRHARGLFEWLQRDPSVPIVRMDLLRQLAYRRGAAGSLVGQEAVSAAVLRHTRLALNVFLGQTRTTSPWLEPSYEAENSDRLLGEVELILQTIAVLGPTAFQFLASAFAAANDFPQQQIEHRLLHPFADSADVISMVEAETPHAKLQVARPDEVAAAVKRWVRQHEASAPRVTTATAGARSAPAPAPLESESGDSLSAQAQEPNTARRNHSDVPTLHVPDPARTYGPSGGSPEGPTVPLRVGPRATSTAPAKTSGLGGVLAAPDTERTPVSTAPAARSGSARPSVVSVEATQPSGAAAITLESATPAALSRAPSRPERPASGSVGLDHREVQSVSARRVVITAGQPSIQRNPPTASPVARTGASAESSPPESGCTIVLLVILMFILMALYEVCFGW